MKEDHHRAPRPLCPYPDRVLLRAALLFLCCLMLAGCAARDTGAPEARFPERPATTLAKTPEQGLAGEKTMKSLAIGGGWGYGAADAIVFTVARGHAKRIYNTVPLESTLVRVRNEVEFTETPPAGQRYVVVDHGKVARTVSHRDGRTYAVWRMRPMLLYEAASPGLYREAAARPLMKRAAPEMLIRARAVPREYWFDVTETFKHKQGPVKTPPAPSPRTPVAKAPAAPALP